MVSFIPHQFAVLWLIQIVFTIQVCIGANMKGLHQNKEWVTAAARRTYRHQLVDKPPELEAVSKHPPHWTLAAQIKAIITRSKLNLSFSFLWWKKMRTYRSSPVIHFMKGLFIYTVSFLPSGVLVMAKPHSPLRGIMKYSKSIIWVLPRVILD